MDRSEKNIREFLIHNVEAHPSDIAKVAAKRFGVSRQAVNRHLRALVAEGILLAQGHTRGRSYALVEHEVAYNFTLSPNLEEDKIWRDVAAPALVDIRDNVLSICQHGFTEMVNNAIDHSEGSTLRIRVIRNAANVELWVMDDGVGIFKKIKAAFGLDDERHAILELAKGKLTTDPAHHTGEGIFFTSRMFDMYRIASGDLFFCHTPIDGDWLLDSAKMMEKGTLISMKISTASERTTREIFDRYASAESAYGFTRTHIPVSLAQYGDDNLISRSQAKRLLVRFERFKEVILDFRGVSMIGQAFADEIFRVFQESHPDVHLRWTYTNEDVEKMIRRARTDGASQSARLSGA
jgi:anti-sigma regulatory factor (Ser/Thr protein kinase)